MQLAARIENMTLSDGVLGAVASFALTWLVSSVLKVSKTEFEKLVTRVANLEKDRITREEFEKCMAKLEVAVEKSHQDIKAEMREIKVEMREIKLKV